VKGEGQPVKGNGSTFSPEQKRLINVMLASAVKKKFGKIAKAGKKASVEKKSDDVREYGTSSPHCRSAR
jgi:hypothetical protein